MLHMLSCNLEYINLKYWMHCSEMLYNNVKFLKMLLSGKFSTIGKKMYPFSTK
jgi:hypothetical protein